MAVETPIKYLNPIPIKRLGVFGEHGHSVGDIVVFVFDGDGIGAKHFHYFAV